MTMRPWLSSIVFLCACSQTHAPAAPVEPAPMLEDERRAAPIVDARPLDPEIVALLTPESLASAAAEPKPPPPDPRTPVERARDICQFHCDRGFDRSRLVRRAIEASNHEPSEPIHGLPPDYSDEEGMRRFVNGERSTVWWWRSEIVGLVIYVNPIFERVTIPFSGTLIEIDEQDRVVRCRHADRDDPAETIDMTCGEL
jgi:hypothetical protein